MGAAKKTKPAEDLDTLEPMLTRLKLTAIRDQLDTLLDQASRAELNLREALTMLCTAEVARKDERRIRSVPLRALAPVAARTKGVGASLRQVWPNMSLKLTRYGKPRLAAPGRSGHCPSAASPVSPPRAA